MTLQRMAASAWLVIALATAGWGTAAAGASTTAADQPVSSQDRMFMNQASRINLTEISLGRYMRAHATVMAARNLGSMYARDHTAAQASLRVLALRLHVALPAKPGAQLESMVARVEAQNGRNMNVAFAQASVSGHQAAIAIFRKEESAGSDRAVKAYAVHYLPTLFRHLRLAKRVESALAVAPAK